MAFMSICIFSLFAAFVSIGEAQKGQCKKTANCICTYDDDWALDLNPIGLQEFGPAMGPDPDFHYFTYWPCNNGQFDTVTGDSCTGAVVQSDDNYYSTWCYVCGLKDNTEFGYDDNGELYIQYTKGDDDRSSRVILRCSADDPGTLQALGESEEKKYDLVLSSKYACPLAPGDQPDEPGKPGGSSSSSSSISPGTILCIIFIVVLTIYIVGGVLLMKYYKGAEGRELVPNYHVWVALPGLIKDGVIFFVSLFPCGKNLSVSSDAKYSNL